MTGTSGLLDFFTMEAGEYLERMDALLADARATGPDADAFSRHARSLRGSATMARLGELAEVAGGVERVAVALRDGTLQWRPPVSDAVAGAVADLRRLVAAVRSWGDAEREAAQARTAELRRAVATAAAPPMASRGDRGPVIPIARLFHADEGPHVVRQAPTPPMTADVRFRAAAVPIAAELRRVIALAKGVEANSPAAQLTAGADVRSALRDLRELAESYDIRPVIAFASAREEAVGSLDARALTTVDAAAAAIMNSGSGARGIPTPVPSEPAVQAPAPAQPPVVEPAPTTVQPPVAEPMPEPAAAAHPAPSRTPSMATPAPSGRALIALLEDSLQGMSMLAEHPFGEAVAADAPEQTDGVSIDQLLYRGRSALDRARQLRDGMRQVGGPPDPAALAELFDLLDLAVTD